MKIRQPIVFAGALGVLFFLGAGMFTRVSESGRPKAGRSHSIAKYLSDRRFEESGLNPTRTTPVQQLERDVLRWKNELNALEGLSGEDLIESFQNWNVIGSSGARVYPEYHTEKDQLEQALQGGFGPGHPKVAALKMSIETKRAQLLAYLELYKKQLSTHIENVEKELAEARRQGEPARSAGHGAPERDAATRFRVLSSPAPNLFENGATGTVSSLWMDAQVRSMTEGDVLARVVENLNLMDEWKMTSAEAAEKLRGITKVSRVGETDVVTVTVRHSDAVKSAELANAVRDAYAAKRESLENERLERLVSTTEDSISEQLAKVEEARSKMMDSMATQSATPANGEIPNERDKTEYARRLQTYESQLQLLNTLREANMREHVEVGVMRKSVELLEAAKSPAAN